MSKLSPLEHLHPNGFASTSLILGSNCPPALQPERKADLDAKIDFIILAPSAEECRAKDWLAEAVRAMGARLSTDGLGYVLISPRWRQKALKLLNDASLVSGSCFWHFPGWSSSRYLVPIELHPAQFAVDILLPATSWKRTLGMHIFRSSATRALWTRIWGPVGISVQRPGARPLFEWLLETQPGTAIVRTSWRHTNGASIVYGFSEREPLPSVIAKIVSEQNTATLLQEAQVLEEVAPAAGRAGARVPEVLRKQQYGPRSSVLSSFVPGRPVADMLVSNPELCGPILLKLVDWLQHWHQTTRVLRPLEREQFTQALLEPLEQLAPLLEDVEQYRNRLVRYSEARSNQPVPWVATHNDLTMANVLLDQHNQLGVVDWETGCAQSWPFVDFFYAVTDAVRCAAKSSNWLEAFQACFLPEGAYHTQVADWRTQLQSALGASADFTELCFHVCWLHHASNEQKVHRAGEARPFLEIVQWLAAHELRFDDNHN